MTTINDIARIANVSKSTVSKVINDYSGVSDKTKNNILKIMKEENYWPNSVARSLSTNKSYTIGIFDPDRLNNFFFREVFDGIERVLGQKGYDILYFTSKKWEESWVDFSFKDKCINRSVDGVLMMGFGHIEQNHFEDLINSNIPSVFIDLDIVGSCASYVTSDNISGSKKAVKYLAKLGHEKIAMIKGPTGFKLANDRFFGFKSALDELGIKYNPNWLFSGEYAIETGYNAMLEIIKMSDKPSAIFAEDIFAIGAIRAIKDNGMDVPDDYSIIGFDNIELGIHYELTTISQNQIGLGESAANLLLNIINKDSFSPLVLPTKLIERKTCRAI
ncbi:LacI family DNA-binding transcriptional regulator [Natronospora cellulosivora (SeqCode)]